MSGLRACPARAAWDWRVSSEGWAHLAPGWLSKRRAYLPPRLFLHGTVIDVTQEDDSSSWGVNSDRAEPPLGTSASLNYRGSKIIRLIRHPALKWLELNETDSTLNSLFIRVLCLILFWTQRQSDCYRGKCYLCMSREAWSFHHQSIIIQLEKSVLASCLGLHVGC